MTKALLIALMTIGPVLNASESAVTLEQVCEHLKAGVATDSELNAAQALIYADEYTVEAEEGTDEYEIQVEEYCDL